MRNMIRKRARKPPYKEVFGGHRLSYGEPHYDNDAYITMNDEVEVSRDEEDSDDE